MVNGDHHIVAHRRTGPDVRPFVLDAAPEGWICPLHPPAEVHRVSLPRLELVDGVAEPVGHISLQFNFQQPPRGRVDK